VRLPRYFVEGQPQHLIQRGNNRELPSRLGSKIATRFSTVGVERGLPDLHGRRLCRWGWMSDRSGTPTCSPLHAVYIKVPGFSGGHLLLKLTFSIQMKRGSQKA